MAKKISKKTTSASITGENGGLSKAESAKTITDLKSAEEK